MLFPTSLVGSYPQPDWLIDRERLAHRFPPRVRARELWRVAPEHLAQDRKNARPVISGIPGWAARHREVRVRAAFRLDRIRMRSLHLPMAPRPMFPSTAAAFTTRSLSSTWLHKKHCPISILER